MRNNLGTALLIAMLVSATPALAAPNQSGDLFGNIYTDRPAVQDDPSRNADFFPDHQDYVRTNKDMFDHTHMEPGVTDMFHSNVHNQPDQQIYQWPKQ